MFALFQCLRSHKTFLTLIHVLLHSYSISSICKQLPVSTIERVENTNKILECIDIYRFFSEKSFENFEADAQCEQILQDLENSLYHVKVINVDRQGKPAEVFVNLKYHYQTSFLHTDLEAYKSSEEIPIRTFSFTNDNGIVEVYQKFEHEEYSKYINPVSSTAVLDCNSYSINIFQSKFDDNNFRILRVFENINEDSSFKTNDLISIFPSRSRYIVDPEDGSNFLG